MLDLNLGLIRLILKKLGRKYSILLIMIGKVRVSKGTLHYMKLNARSDKPFNLNNHVLKKVKAWESLVSENQFKV